MVKWASKTLKEMFKDVRRGDVHVSNKLETGDVPLIGCGFLAQGVEGHFDLNGHDLFTDSLTITGDGSYPMTTFYHNYEFGAKDNVIVCVPKEEHTITTIYYLSQIINRERWRFSYGRKCYVTKMKSLKFRVPVKENNELDIDYIEKTVKIDLNTTLKNLSQKLFQILAPIPDNFQLSNEFEKINDKFTVSGGKSKNGLKNYIDGLVPYVSSGSTNNSIVGMVEPLDIKEISTPPAITVTAFCQARVQLWDFIARGNGGSAVKILKPRKKMTTGELFWYASQINLNAWHYNYGLMVSQDRLRNITVQKPPEEFKVNLSIDEII